MPEVWTKHIAPEDEDLWETRLEVLAEGKFAMAHVVGKQRLKIQVFAKTIEEALDLKQRFGGRVETLPDQNWVALSQTDPILVKVRDRLVVTSVAEPEALQAIRDQYPDRVVLTIPAELAFGTGDHETTSTCLRMLVDVASERCKLGASWQLLDLGTGTGVLAIASRWLGAARALGWENDPLALVVAQKNVRANGLDTHDVAMDSNDVLAWEPDSAEWDVICANMFSKILIATFPKIRRALKPGGTLIVSGILQEQAEETLAAAALAGLEMTLVKQVGKWVTART
jgi:ribosomal protein L11 methyltransferase